ncbi:MAG: hypothetical protein AAB412_02175 [Elusimicrobiota bacterium]
MRLLLLSLALLAPAPARAAAPALPAEKPAAAAQAASTEPVRQGVSALYDGERYRDPFQPPKAASTGGGAPIQDSSQPQEFSIHLLNLKGILKDRRGSYAILTDTLGGSFILKDGKLFDYKNKPLPGVTGAIQPKQKSVTLMTPDKDVQVLRIGEEEGPEERQR